MTDVLVSVIICTHNPRRDYLQRVLEALKSQTLPNRQWELLVIDNASRNAVSALVEVSWHPRASLICENELGLTHARLRGIFESTGGLLVFVDDDNVLHPDYLRRACSIAQEFPKIGAFGGSSHAEYAVAPPDWFMPYQQIIAVREVAADRWSNNPEDASSTPLGAGLVITRKVGLHYLAKAKDNPARTSLGRRGADLSGGEDIDIALMACDLGLGKGVFEKLELWHLIPECRTERAYLLKLYRAMAASVVVRRHLRGESFELLRTKLLSGLTGRCITWLRDLARDANDRRMQQAWRLGLSDGLRRISDRKR